MRHMRYASATATTPNGPSTPAARLSSAMSDVKNTNSIDAGKGDTKNPHDGSRGLLPADSRNISVEDLGLTMRDGEDGTYFPPPLEPLRELVESTSRRPSGQDLCVAREPRHAPSPFPARPERETSKRFGEQFSVAVNGEDTANERRLQPSRELKDKVHIPRECEATGGYKDQKKKRKNRQRKRAKKGGVSKRGEDRSTGGRAAWARQGRKEKLEQRTIENWESELESELEQDWEQDLQRSHESPDPVLVSQANDNSPASAGRVRPKKPFFPVGTERHWILGLARFDDELLGNVRKLNVPMLHDAIWVLNRDGELSGGFGYVERALWNDQDIGVKFLKGTQTDSGMARGKRSFLREIIAWSKLTHPNILPFLGVICADKYLGMASPYMPNGSAPKYIAKHADANVLQILCDVASGLRHLAAQNPPIAHGDLKGSNVLIDQNGRACICDFGLSKFIKDFKSIDTRRGGTIRWMAPEQILSETFLVSLSADIFSWGMFSFELMTGSVPWEEVQQDAAIVVKVAVRNQRPARPTCKTQRCQLRPQCACLIGNDILWDLIQKCWLREPDERPTAAQLCEALAQEPTDYNHT